VTVTTGYQRRSELLDLLTDGEPTTPLVQRVCEVSVHLLDVSGAGMALVGGRRQQILVHGTDPLSEELEDLQVALGQGPCIEAVRTGVPLLVPRLDDYDAPTWPVFAEQALLHGVHALFAFPLRAGTVQLGALDLYRDRAGPLTDEQFRDAVLLTQIVDHAMLAQRDRVYLNGTVSALHWLGDHDQAHTTGPGRAVDSGLTVEQAPAPPWPDGANDALASDPGE